MPQYDKDEIKSKLTLEQIYDIVEEFGGEPKLTDFGLIAATICHNNIGEGSHKLYYYDNTHLFKCYTGCDSTFDIFELMIKIHNMNNAIDWELYDAVAWIADRFGYGPKINNENEAEKLSDWQIFNRYDKLQLTTTKENNIKLREYDRSILTRLKYPLILPWMQEGILNSVIKRNLIGYYPGGEQISIPHFDIENRLIGIRGRALSQEAAEVYGKYRPLIIGEQLYNHPLGLNLYNLNNSQHNIKIAHKAIVFEGEKSCLLYQSYFGSENDISVACCGSSLGSFQIQLLLDAGADEIIVAFDKQFQEIGDKEFKHLTKNLTSIHQKYNKYVNITFIFDKEDILRYKDSPIDRGKSNFSNLYYKRISL